MAVLTFDAFWRDHGAKAGLRGLSAEAREAEKRQHAFRQQATLAGAAVGAALFKLGKDSVTVASDINESQSKVQVVFGKSAAAVQRLAETSAESMGLSKASFLDAAGTLGNLFVSLKLPQKAAADMSTRMLKLAGDMASFNNASPEEVLEALRSGLVGETEPLRRFGVNLSAAAVEAEALSMGLVKATGDTEKIKLAQARADLAQRAYTRAVREHGKDSDQARRALVAMQVAQNGVERATKGVVPELTAAQKAQATYSLITKQTTTAQGDFERTSSGLANQQRILKARFSDLQGELGAKLLPVAVKVTTALVGLLGFISDHGKGVAITAGAVAALVVAVKGLNAASAVVDSWRNLAAAIGGAGDKAKGARGALGRVAGMAGAGGPWGIAIAAGVTLVGAFAESHRKAAARVDDLAGALDKESGALTKAARAQVVKTLQDQGAFDAAKALGISVRDVTEAALGNEAAQKRVTRAVEAAAAQYRAMTPEQRNSNEWARRLAERNTILQNAIGGSNKELDNARRKLAEAKVRQADAAEATESNTKAQRRQRDAVAELRREMNRLPKSATVTVGAVVRYPKDWQQYRSGERMAVGGQVGDGEGSVDDVPALLMRGEHVWTTREVKAAGGHGAMYRLRRAALAGQLPGYADGGPVGVPLTTRTARGAVARVESILEGIAGTWARYLQRQLGALGGASLGGMGWARQWAAVHSAFPWATLHSAYRPGAVTLSGNRSYHSLGRAIDTDPSMAIFRWIRSTYGARTKELIYSPAGSQQIKNGRDHYYTGAVRATHFNHVHWAYDRGGYADGAGWIPKGPKPERVLSPRQTVAFERLVAGGFGGAGRPVQVTLVAPNYVGSRSDLQRTLVELAKSGQLDVILKGRY